MATPQDKFDHTKPLAVELMNKTSFGRWMAEAHNEASYLFDFHFFWQWLTLIIQVSNHINSGLSKPARTMIRLSLSGYISAGTHLRKVAQLEVSETPGRFTEEVQEDMLVTLRDAYETARKLFMFSLINAKSGLTDAADVIETEDGLLSKKEMKRMEAVRTKPRKKYESSSSKTVTLEDLAKLLGRSKPAAASRDLSRVICFKCQKPGHFATSCPGVDKKKGFKRVRKIESSSDDEN